MCSRKRKLQEIPEFSTLVFYGHHLDGKERALFHKYLFLNLPAEIRESKEYKKCEQDYHSLGFDNAFDSYHDMILCTPDKYQKFVRKYYNINVIMTILKSTIETFIYLTKPIPYQKDMVKPSEKKLMKYKKLCQVIGISEKLNLHILCNYFTGMISLSL